MTTASTLPSPRYRQAFRDLIVTEGGAVDDPLDRGGATKYGVSLRFLVAEGKIDFDGDGRADFDLDMDGDIDGEDIRRLTLAHADAIYYRCFWQRLGCDTFPAPLGEALFDQAVNGGLLAARKLLQEALNRLPGGHTLKVDGAVGPATRARLVGALARCGMPAVMDALRAVVRRRYRAIVAANPSQKRFLRGWLARADKLGRA